MDKCITCNATLTGKQKKFCSRRCSNNFGNNKHQNYVAQQSRGIQRRLELIKEKGNQCEVCGYSKNSAALEFHHKDPNNKEFSITLRECSNHSLQKLKDEVVKCSLLCANCHREYHNPEMALTN